MKKGTRIIFALILLFVTVFADVRFVKAETNPGTATVYRIYAKMVENEEGYYEPDFDSLEIAENNPQGKDLIAKFITDGTYVPKISIKDPTDAEVMLFLNNVTIDLRGSGEDRIKRFWDWRLAGDSSVLFDNMTVSTKNGDDVNELDVFPALSGDATIENISSVFGPYPYDLLRDENDPDKIIKYPKAPRYDITGEHMVEGEIFAGNLVIADGAVLYMKDFEAENGGTNGGIVEATNMDINGTLKMDAPSNEWAPPQIRVYADGALNLGSKGSFDVAEGIELILHDNASCNDSVKSMLYKNDGSQFAWQDSHGKIKFIFENGKWIYREPVFGVDFDEWGRWDEKLDRNVPSASVSANGTDLARGEMISFKEGEEIIFNFTMPEERSGCKPYIAIESEEYC
ncbi:MAG: hypothetical protein II399_07445, partial [Lachnospiraceae bacterium]|nr:hypothetical protein [Lachnospiraceae bacterium]